MQASACVRASIWSGVLGLALTSSAAPRQPMMRRRRDQGRSHAVDGGFQRRQRRQGVRLFAPDLIAQYRGQPERNYEALCGVLQRSLSDRSKSYQYSLVIKEIIVAGDLAVVGLVWTLK